MSMSLEIRPAPTSVIRSNLVHLGDRLAALRPARKTSTASIVAGSAGTDFSLRNVPENSKRRNQENTGNRIGVMYLYFRCEERTLLKRVMARTVSLDHKLQEVTLNGIYGHYGNEL
jgi:hypothetical protein